MDLIRLQDMLKGMPDDRLKQELDAPTGMVPQYLVLSEVVRRDKVRGSQPAEMPKTTVVEDVRNAASQALSPMAQQYMAAMQAQQQQMPQQQMPQDQAAPEEMPQEEAPAYANGGFITPATAMANAGIRGFQPVQAQQQPMNFGTTQSMFAPTQQPQQQQQMPQQQQPININVQTPTQAQAGTEQESYPKGMASGGEVRMKNGGYTPEMKAQIERLAKQMGVSAGDLGTILSYETAGTLSPTIKGPKTKWGQHVGLLQMGEPQRKQYGYDPNGDLESQFDAIGRYFTDNGVKPGMDMANLYSIANAGAPGLLNRSDAKAGGMPGTVLDKVQSDAMAQHRAKIAKMFQNNASQVAEAPAAAPTQNRFPPAPPKAPAPAPTAVAAAAPQSRLADATGNTGFALSKPAAAAPSFFANLMNNAKTNLGNTLGKDLQAYAENLVKGPAPMQVDSPVGTPGDPSAVLNTKTNPNDVFASLTGVRGSPFASIMADGGYVNKYADGGKITYNPITGTYIDESGNLVPSDKVTTEQLLGMDGPQASPAQAGARDDRSPAAPPSRGSFNPLTSTYTNPDNSVDSSGIGSLWNLFGNKATPKALPPGVRGPSGPDGTQRMYDDANPKTLALLGKAKERNDNIAARNAPKEPSPMELYVQAIKDGNQQMIDFLEKQAAAEEAKGSAQQGIGAFLRAAGMGMLGAAGGNSFNAALASGLNNAIANRENARMTSAEKAAEIRAKAQLMGIKSIGDLSKMQYEAAVANNASHADLVDAAKDAYKNYTDMVTSYTKEGVPPTPEQQLELQQAKEYAMRLSTMAGLPSIPQFDPAAARRVLEARKAAGQI